jgi:hypothetical protein
VIAGTDLDRAIDLRMNGLRRSSVTWLNIPLLSDLDNPAYLADKALNGDDDALLEALLSRWATSASSEVIAWMRGKESLPPQTISSVAQEVLRYNNIQEAFDYAHLLGEDQRSMWIQSAAFAGAFYDAEGTINALQAFQQESFYDQALSAVLASTASGQGPRRAAELAGSAPPPQAAMMIGHRWADESPREAAAWALTLTDSIVRTETVESVAEIWIRNDRAAASLWINELTDYNLRTRILGRVCPQFPDASICG